MLIRCPQCSAGYEFPVEQLPPAGVKAKCARCGFVMLVRPDVGALDPESGLAQKPFQRRAGGDEQTVKVERREERAVEEGPSIVVDMGLLTPQQKAAAEASAEEPLPIDLAAFAPLSAPVDATPRPERPAHFPGPVAEVADVEEVRPPGMWRAAVIFILLILGGFILMIGVRSDWQVDWTDPRSIQEALFKVRERPRSAPDDLTAPVVAVEGVQGELTLSDLEASRLPGGAVWIHGQIINQSNRAQRGIILELSLLDRLGGVPLKTRTVACCDDFDAASAKAVAADRAHPHFEDNFSRASKITLNPGERRPISAILLDVPGGGALHPQGRIKSSEVEALDAAQAP